MTHYELDLSKMNAEELAALYIALRGHVSMEQQKEIIGAGEANCGGTEYRTLSMEVKFCHDERLSKAA